MKLYNLTVHEVSDKLRNKEISCRELVESVLNRIDEVENLVQSYITICRKSLLLSCADKIDTMIKNGQILDDLAGIPMAVKDNICTKNLQTTCASKMLKNFISPYDATAVKKLYDKNAILLGKTNMDEFAMGSSTENSAFKITKNPWDLNRVPGGSSGGSAASVASGEAFFALGSDTGGSIRQPASFCGLVGLKPTYGLISRYGLVAYASSLEQIGPITKDVKDCALVLNTIAGYDNLDSTSVKRRKVNYLKCLKQDVKDIKIGVPIEYFGSELDEDIKKKIFNALDILEGLGAKYDEVSLPHMEYALPAYYIIAAAECSCNLSRFDGIRYGYRAESYNGIEDLLIKTRSKSFGDEVKRRIIFGTYCLSKGYYDEYYNRALKVRTLIKNDFQKIFDEYDVIIMPTTATVAFKLGEKKQKPLEMYMSDLCTVPVNITGFPAISIPCGFKNGLPIGLQIIGNYFEEETILRVAYTFEQNTEYHRKRSKLGKE
ncbi:aspartyl/glutamyl-tRNA(Asn/Gln) amidotransferase subunit A [Caminicella sporogenes DSM 14501]|uniref:Glutamyl-tRNA(Gln) amidotransferase subunit A n=1 Tax=Caminicella sporogenes DSM 14501 TaxID=1121266 RepID=A0A1M6T059_9FIRM|nr:Asp-tRNA(Asn)/Glu-tRNA(Gln) amidotransferase subunit GatA [Caminicella sporogenes]RKD26383.1 aspartyl/glutamyl-tRNA amidotransferase subunit A [Caminicella sporogenes]SHK50306.1 aspartyl/glutamyl-tRNA(Asn/Gln) amidotransferase subunit A [Caminicella sporogenes DSM 14501]